MMEAREKAPLEDNSYMFKKLFNSIYPLMMEPRTLRLLRIRFEA